MKRRRPFGSANISSRTAARYAGEGSHCLSGKNTSRFSDARWYG